jgi:PAS domain S-box-containing protein
MAGVRGMTRLLLPLSVAALVIAALAALLIVLNTQKHRDREAARLEAIADLRTGQVETWVREKTDQAQFAGKSPLGEIYVRWVDEGIQERREFLARRLDSLRDAVRADAALVIDGSGRRLASPASAIDVSPALMEATRLAQEQNATRFTPLYRPSAQSSLRFEVVAPLVATGQPARAAVVLRFEPEETLLRNLRQWPLPSRTGTAQLVLRDGDALIGSSGRTRVPLSTPGLLAAQVVRGDAPAGRAIDANDFSGEPVLGVVRQVPGTPWYLVANIDRDEAYAGAWRDGWAIGAGALLAFVAAAAAAHWAQARQALRLAETRRSLQEERLHALRLVESIARNSSDAIFAKDREGRYVLCNGPAAQALGRTPEDMLGRLDAEVLPAGQLATAQASDAEVMATGRTATYQVRLAAPQGEAVYLTTKGPLRDGDGQVTGVFGISRDITELQRYRERLEQLVDERTRELAAKNRELERSLGDMEAFSYTLSHDLRQPLRTVAGFANVLQRKEAAVLSDEGRRRLGRIAEGAHRMDRMIDDILRCSRAERVPLEPQIVDLREVVREVLEDVEPAFPHCVVEVGALPVVRADPGAARQVLANLIGNALKFSARADQPRVEVGLAPDGMLYVRDNGVGFDPQLAPQLFKPFQRLHADDSGYPGTGVGLSIVKRLLERHGGEIRAESRPGRGTTFAFSFGPVAPG